MSRVRLARCDGVFLNLLLRQSLAVTGATRTRCSMMPPRKDIAIIVAT